MKGCTAALDSLAVESGNKTLQTGFPLLDKAVFDADPYGEVHDLFVFFVGYPAVQRRNVGDLGKRRILIHDTDIYVVLIRFMEIA